MATRIEKWIRGRLIHYSFGGIFISLLGKDAERVKCKGIKRRKRLFLLVQQMPAKRKKLVEERKGNERPWRVMLRLAWSEFKEVQGFSTDKKLRSTRKLTVLGFDSKGRPVYEDRRQLSGTAADRVRKRKKTIN